MIWNSLKSRIQNRIHSGKVELRYRVNSNADWKVYRRFHSDEEKQRFLESMDRNHFIQFK